MDFGPSKEERIILALERAGKRGLTSNGLAKSSGLTPATVRRVIHTLRNYDYKIVHNASSGYRLVKGTQRPVPWEVRKRLKSKFIGTNMICYHKHVRSTQKLALDLAETGNGVHGAVIIAETQSSGRGRLSRKWVSPAGGLWLSVVLIPNITLDRCVLLPLVGALAVCAAIKKCTGLNPSLKWPNDVLLRGRKVAGILGDTATEDQRVKYSVLGIGVNANVNSTQLNEIAQQAKTTMVSSLRIEFGRDVDRIELAAELLNSLESYYRLLAEYGSAEIINQWKANSDMLGRNIVVLQDGERITGKAVDVQQDGNLIVETRNSKLLTVSSGDVKVTMKK